METGPPAEGSQTEPPRGSDDPAALLGLRGLAIGSVIDRRYRVDAVIGAGGQGIVLEVTHLDLGKTRALKLMRSREAEDPVALTRFMREARAAASLASPHVVRVFDVGRLDDGTPFLVMERLRGKDLRRCVRERGALAPVVAVGWMVQALRGLAEAHASGLVHRDIKPSNLFLCDRAARRPLVKILDFGLAKRPRPGVAPAEAGEVTLGSELVGSPLHMAPEQMRDARNVDARADLWAIGTVLHVCLTGDTPFHGHTVADIVAAVLTEEPPSIRASFPELAPALADVVRACLSKRPEGRPPNARALADALLAALSDEDRREAEAWADVAASAPEPDPVESADGEEGALAPAPSAPPRRSEGDPRPAVPEAPGDATVSAQGDVGPRPAEKAPPPPQPATSGAVLPLALIAAVAMIVAIGATIVAVQGRGADPKGAPGPSAPLLPASAAPVVARAIPPHTKATLSAALGRGGFKATSVREEQRSDGATIVVVAEAAADPEPGAARTVLKLEYDVFTDAAAALQRAQEFSVAMWGAAPALVDGPRVLAWTVVGPRRDDPSDAAKAWALVEGLTAEPE